MKTAALLIGVNYVKDTSCRLNGCWNDAMMLYSLLTSTYAFPLDTIQLVLDNDTNNDNCSKANIIISLLELAKKSWSENLVTVVISYSGHGTYIPDRNGDEMDGRDECLCPSDFRTSGLIKDDDLLCILRTFNPKTRIFIVADCCHSGTILDLPFVVGKTAYTDVRANRDIEQFIVVVSGCIDSQTSAETYDAKMQKYGGVLTSSLVHILSTNNKIGILDMHRELSETIKSAGYSQIPVVSFSKEPSNNIRIFS